MGTKIQYLCAMDYQDCIAYLYTKLPMFSRTGSAALKMDLSNTQRICEVLGNPEQRVKTIHIAGTNGKGSVSHMLASILQEQGYKTGLYTSPHLYDFRERIRINGAMIPEDRVIAFTQKMIPLIESIEPSFFEVTVGMAFDHFAIEKVDFAIIETGLGGRLDSTNVITPLLSIITNIGFDHMSILGNTLSKIASEKAGIIKKGVPVVIGKKDPETASVFMTQAEKTESPLIFAEDVYEIADYSFTHGNIMVQLQESSTYTIKTYRSPLAGIYQSENIRTVISGIKSLQSQNIIIDEGAIERGISSVIQNTELRGRWEMVQKNPIIILDVAHNPAGIQVLSDQLKITPHKKLYLILGLSQDKDADGILDLLPKYAYYGFTRANLPRALDSNQLAEKAVSIGLQGESYPNVNIALDNFMRIADDEDLIVVCGSIFIVGEVDRTKFH